MPVLHPMSLASAARRCRARLLEGDTATALTIAGNANQDAYTDGDEVAKRAFASVCVLINMAHTARTFTQAMQDECRAHLATVIDRAEAHVAARRVAGVR